MLSPDFEALEDEIASLKADAASAWDKCEERRIENEALKIAHRSHEDSNLKMLAKLKQQAFAEKELRAALVECQREMTRAIPHLEIHFDWYFEALARCEQVLGK